MQNPLCPGAPGRNPKQPSDAALWVGLGDLGGRGDLGKQGGWSGDSGSCCPARSAPRFLQPHVLAEAVASWSRRPLCCGLQRYLPGFPRQPLRALATPLPPAPGCAAGRGTMVSLSSVCTVGHSALLESRAQPLSPGVLETLPGSSPSQPPSQSPPPGPPAVGPAAGMSALRGSVPYLQYQDPRAFCSHHQEARPFPGSPRPPAAHLCARVCACACAQEQVCVQVRAPPLAKAPGQREVKLKTAWRGGRVRHTRQKRRGLV